MGCSSALPLGSCVAWSAHIPSQGCFLICAIIGLVKFAEELAYIMFFLRVVKIFPRATIRVTGAHKTESLEKAYNKSEKFFGEKVLILILVPSQGSRSF